MDDRPPMTPFDCLVTTPQLQAMKLLLPYLPCSSQRMMASVIKFMELRQTIFLFRRLGKGLRAQDVQGGEAVSPEDMLNQLKPYLSPEDSRMLDTVLSMKDMMGMVSSMQSSGDGGSMEPSELIMGMLSPEQRESFQMYSSLFSEMSDNIDSEKGENENGGMDEPPEDEEPKP